MPALDSAQSRHRVSKNVSSKVENSASDRIKSDVVTVDLTLNRARLVWTLEISGDLIAVLRDLDMLDLCRAVIIIRGVNCPVALHVVWLGQRCLAKDQRRENKTSNPQRRVH